jgi:RNA polymerase sigma-70 factor (ECF subfamily)
MEERARGVAAAGDRESGRSAPDEFGRSGDAVPAAPICLEALYREESPRLLRLLARKTSSADEALDMVHDIFCRIVRLGGRGPLRLERPQAYLSRMATNLLRDRSKRDSRQMRSSHVSVDDEMPPGIDQQRLLESRDMLTRIEAAMLRLRPRTREIFMAHRIDGLSYAEIAERTGLSVKGVEKQMSKAIAQIDRMLDRS